MRVLAGGNQYCSTLPATPMANDTAMATPRLRNRAATTAANAAAISWVKASADRPMIGASSMPQTPARNVDTIHTAREIRNGLPPDSDVIAGESTIARTASPASVNRRTANPIPRMATTKM